jgi:hypothetical protein
MCKFVLMPFTNRAILWWWWVVFATVYIFADDAVSIYKTWWANTCWELSYTAAVWRQSCLSTCSPPPSWNYIVELLSADVFVYYSLQRYNSFFFLYYHNRFGGLLDADHSSSSGRYYTHYAICPAIGEILCILLLFLFIILTFQFDPSTVVGISLVTYIYSRHI